MRWILPCTVALMLVGCQPEVVEPSAAQIRTAIEPRLVKLYIRTPHKYEMLGKIEVTDPELLQYGPDKSIDKVMDAMIAQAAAKGANGLLLPIAEPAGADHAVYGGYYRNAFVHIVVRNRPAPAAAVAQAIYVLED